MASNINPYNIDGTFPVAGQDNSSQGFRDNFTNTKNNFLFAQSEITDLQNKVLVTSALNGQTVNNDMAGTKLTRPQLSAWTQTLLDNGAVTGALSLDFNQANFQKITAAGNISLSFINWPTSVGTGALGYGVMRLWIVITNKNQTVTLPSSVNIADDSLSNYNGAGALAFDTAGSYLFDISSIDGGTSYIIQDLTRNRAQFADTNFYYNILTSPTMFVGFGGGYLNSSNSSITGYFNTGLTNIKSYSSSNDMLVTSGSVNSVGIGNLTLANVAYGLLDTGTVGGFTVTSARGNILTTGAQPVTSNDMIGYVNAETFTGNGTPTIGNVFQQVAGMYFFASGANLQYGLGGNISFYTVPDGGPATSNMKQALSIENDQSTHIYGALNTASTIIESGTLYTNLAVAGATITMLSTTSTLILDNTASANYATPVLLNLPAVPVNGQKIKIAAVCPISTANVWAGAIPVKYVSGAAFSAGNVVTSLTYISSVNTWYRS